jgi:hypothetical protein
VCIETLHALWSNLDGLAPHLFSVARKSVSDARNEIAREARGFPDALLLWVDDDAWWAPGTIERMIELLGRLHEFDVVAGWFTARAPFFPPMAFREDDTPVTLEEGKTAPELIEVSLVGGHCLMHRVSLLAALSDDPFSIPAGSPDPEDFVFARRVRAAGGRIFVAPELPIAHIEASTGLAYLPNIAAGRIIDNKFSACSANVAPCAQGGRRQAAVQMPPSGECRFS